MPVDPIVPIQTSQTAPAATPTPGQIAELRRYAAVLQKPTEKTSFYTWANGLDDVSRQVASVWADKNANYLERLSGRQSGGSALGLPQPTPSYATPTSNPFNPFGWLTGS